MADTGVRVDVIGERQLQANLREFASNKILGRICRVALEAGGRIVRPRAAANARAQGLGFMGFKKDGHGHESPRYGRIPKSIKVGRAYLPRGGNGTFRVNVLARSQAQAGIFKNKAPHAHLIEYGFTTRKGQRVGGRPFIGPALTTTASAVTEKIRDTLDKKISQEKFPQ